jgi:hypothetical protein
MERMLPGMPSGWRKNCWIRHGTQNLPDEMIQSIWQKRSPNPPEGYFNLTEMLSALIAVGTPVKVCGSCMTRCGIHRIKPLLRELCRQKCPNWRSGFVDCDKVLSFNPVENNINYLY